MVMTIPRNRGSSRPNVRAAASYASRHLEIALPVVSKVGLTLAVNATS
jgi:hypothetical protein